MSQRYNSRRIIVNNGELYEELLENRGLNKINHFESPRLKYPTEKQILNLDMTSHIWTVGDKFYKLAYANYGDPKYWWVIAMFNHTPTEAHVQPGQEIVIPLPLEKILHYFGT